MLVLACAMAASSGTALAQQHVHPRLFVLPATTFPSGSQITRSSVETNRQLLADQAVHFGLPPAVIGRISGYYMVAHQGDAYTSYLVSIFASAHQAQAAYDYRWELWYTANFYTAPEAAPIRVGSRGAVALFHTLDPQRAATTELFFRRGSVLVEVMQGTAEDVPSAEETRSLHAIARVLDAVARLHPQGI
jgi:hypothetical protein